MSSDLNSEGDDLKNSSANNQNQPTPPVSPTSTSASVSTSNTPLLHSSNRDNKETLPSSFKFIKKHGKICIYNSETKISNPIHGNYKDYKDEKKIDNGELAVEENYLFYIKPPKISKPTIRIFYNDNDDNNKDSKNNGNNNELVAASIWVAKTDGLNICNDNYHTNLSHDYHINPCATWDLRSIGNDRIKSRFDKDLVSYVTIWKNKKFNWILNINYGNTVTNTNSNNAPHNYNPSNRRNAANRSSFIKFNSLKSKINRIKNQNPEEKSSDELDDEEFDNNNEVKIEEDIYCTVENIGESSNSSSGNDNVNGNGNGNGHNNLRKIAIFNVKSDTLKINSHYIRKHCDNFSESECVPFLLTTGLIAKNSFHKLMQEKKESEENKKAHEHDARFYNCIPLFMFCGLYCN